MSFRFDKKLVIVTGGASGIGRAIAEGFAREGARVCIADLSAEKCDEVAASIGGGAFGHRLDVSDLTSITTLVADVVANAGGIDILVNAAGLFTSQLITDVTLEEFERVYNVNTRGLLFMVQGVARQMIAQASAGGGAIVNIASGAGRRPSPASAVYSSSKAAVISITQCAALELIPHGIRVNAIAPGPVRTAMWDDVRAAYAKIPGMSADDLEKMQVAASPIGRMSTPDEYVGLALFLASAEASYIVGQTYNVDGGMFLN